MTLISSVTLFIIGCLIIYLTGRRRFNRRGITGLETFRSYEEAVLIRLMETIVRFLAWIMILAGLFLFAVDQCNSVQ